MDVPEDEILAAWVKYCEAAARKGFIRVSGRKTREIVELYVETPGWVSAISFYADSSNEAMPKLPGDDRQAGFQGS